MKNFRLHLNRQMLVTMALLLTLAFPSLAQKITVTGHVADELGEDLIGATVMEKGTTNGVSADIDGNFTINVAPNATLVVSYVGYDPMDVPVNGQTHLNIVMKENAQMLAETVVIGYGSVKKSDATGSVAVVTPDDIDAGISTSAQDLLVGASPGVTVTTSGGDPSGNANIRIRGGSSLSASNDPLIVIDGVPQTNAGNAGGTNALTMLNPQNIESMTILKDASATAIYGSRASNGVIIITTKKGKSGRPQVNFAANWHVNTPRNKVKVLGSNEYVDLISQYGNERANQMLQSEGYKTDADGNSLYDAANPYANLNHTNWQDEILRTSFSQDYSLSVGGAAGVLPYRVNASYTNNQGILKKSDMQRTTVGFNLSPKFFNDALKITANASGSYIRSNTPDNTIGAAVGLAPVYPVYKNYPTTGDAGLTMFNGFYNITKTTGEYENNASQNPVQQVMDQTKLAKTLSSVGNLQIDYALYWVPELHFNLNLGYQVAKTHYTQSQAANSIMTWDGAYKDGAPRFYNEHQLSRNTLLDFYVNYKKFFDVIKSDVDVTVGYDWQRTDWHSNNNGWINTDLGYSMLYQAGNYILNYDPATEGHVGHTYNDNVPVPYANINQLVSFFGRVNYIFDDTYLLTFTLRDDGTSRFSKDNRWGLFPALALGWKINNMKFMERTQGWLNDFKLRLGWGKTGQQEMSGMYFPYLPIYTESTTKGFLYLDPNGSGQWINPYYPGAYNADLKWETTTTWNVGIDMGFMNNRITLAADWYLRKTTDLLSYVPTAASNTSNKMWNNIGDLENIGVEVTVTAKPVITEDFTWNTAVNVAWNKNKITRLLGNVSTEAERLSDIAGTPIQWHIVGKPSFTFRMYEQVYDEAGNPMEGIYVDQTGEGQINDADLIDCHSRDPKVTLTWNNNFQWKDWDLGISLRGNFGNYVYNDMQISNTRVYNISAAQYQLSNLMANRPLFYDSSSAELLKRSSYFVQNASFIRCDNITLGYTFRNLLQDKLTLRLFAAVQNPFVITKYKGLDPEIFNGIDSSPYPRPITTTLGLVATF